MNFGRMTLVGIAFLLPVVPIVGLSGNSGERTSGYTPATRPIIQRLPGKTQQAPTRVPAYPADLSVCQSKVDTVIARNGVNVAVEIVANSCYGIAVATKNHPTRPELFKFWVSMTNNLRKTIPKTTNPSKQSGYDMKAAVDSGGIFGAIECIARHCDRLHKDNPQLTWGQQAKDLRRCIPPMRRTMKPTGVQRD